MSADMGGAGEPDLSQFDPGRFEFATVAEEIEYTLALDAFRTACRERGVIELHARPVDPAVPASPADLHALARTILDIPHRTPRMPAAPVVGEGFTAHTVAGGVVFVQGRSVNWMILEGDHGPVLIDTGYPADDAAVRASLATTGHTVKDLAAILITHGHGDHIGNAAAYAQEAGCPVYTAAAEIPNVRRDITEQITIPALLPHILRRGVAGWARHAIRAGGKSAPPIPDTQPLPDKLRQALGLDITPVPLPGHTRGHTGFLLPSVGVLIVGDALVTAHPTSCRRGPQLLPRMFHADPGQALRALRLLQWLDAKVVLPGHGPHLTTTAPDAATTATQTGFPY